MNTLNTEQKDKTSKSEEYVCKNLDYILNTPSPKARIKF